MTHVKHAEQQREQAMAIHVQYLQLKSVAHLLPQHA